MFKKKKESLKTTIIIIPFQLPFHKRKKIIFVKIILEKQQLLSSFSIYYFTYSFHSQRYRSHIPYSIHNFFYLTYPIPHSHHHFPNIINIPNSNSHNTFQHYKYYYIGIYQVHKQNSNMHNFLLFKHHSFYLF